MSFYLKLSSFVGNINIKYDPNIKLRSSVNSYTLDVEVGDYADKTYINLPECGLFSSTIDTNIADELIPITINEGDLNDIKSINLKLYKGYSSDNILNLPFNTGYSFNLEVFGFLNNYCIQRITQHKTYNINVYERLCLNNKWTEWEKVLHECDLPKKTNIIRGTTIDDTPINLKLNGTTHIITPVDNKFIFRTNEEITVISNIFNGCGTIKTIDLSRFDVSKVTSLAGAFSNCKELVEVIGLENWDTSNVTTMAGTFYNCQQLVSLDLSWWDTSNVTTISQMFENCNHLVELNLNYWDTSKMTTFKRTFMNCKELVEIKGLRGFNTSNVTDMMALFYECQKLKSSIDVENWDVSKVTDMSFMFRYNLEIISIDLSKWDVSNVTNMNATFVHLHNATEITGLENWNTSKVELFAHIFNTCQNLTTLNLSNWSSVSANEISDMFQSCTKLTSVDLSNFSPVPLGDDNIHRIFIGTIITYIKCNKVFKDWCIENQDIVKLPAAMKEGGTGTWEIVD